MRERPILFSAPMVRALLAGTKTQTRRVVKVQPPYQPALAKHLSRRDYPVWHCEQWQSFCPYGQPGDRLYVRETWAQPTSLDPGPTFYRADYPVCVPSQFENIPPDDQITWKPSIHMPRALSRITLEIVAVRVERLNDISEADALAEGIQPTGDGAFHVEDDRCRSPHASETFARLWESINGPGSWAANPWVWVIEFRRIK